MAHRNARLTPIVLPLLWALLPAVAPDRLLAQTATPPATNTPASSAPAAPAPPAEPEPLVITAPPNSTPAIDPTANVNGPAAILGESTATSPLAPRPGDQVPTDASQAAAPPAAPPTAPPVETGPPGAAPDRINFELKFPKERGGGAAAGSAGNLEYKTKDSVSLTGGVQIRYQDINLKSDQAEMDLNTKLVTATGNVILDQGPRRLTGTTLTFNLDSKTGKMLQASATVSPDYYFTGTEIDKTGDSTYEVTQGVFTSCSQPTPDWSFKLSRATVEVEGYAHIHNTSMRVKKLPFLYLPYVVWPVKKDRASGFLVPNFGFSANKGALLGLAYFQTLGRSWDTTVHVDSYTKGFLGLGNELRYAPSPGTKGDLLGYLIRDPNSIDSEWRWKVEWNHTTTDLPFHMRGVVQFQDFSDFRFFRDFERSFDRNTLRFIDSRAFVTGNWGPHLLNILLNQRETFIGLGNILDTSIVARKLPEIEYTLRKTRLGKSPFYMQFDGTTSYLDIDRPSAYAGRYGRIDLQPQLTLPIRTFTWLNLELTAGERLTWYGDSLNAAGNTFTGEALTRTLPIGNAQIVGPSFSRIFTAKLGNFGKFKHIIEPRWVYNYQGDYDDFSKVPLFDEVDQQLGLNRGTFTFSNRLLAKPDTADGQQREILTVELSRAISFDSNRPLEFSSDRKTTSSAGPLGLEVRVSPTEKTSFRFNAGYSVLFNHLASTGLTGNLNFSRGNYAGVTWFTTYQPQIGKSVGNNLRLSGGVQVVPGRLGLEGFATYDFETKLLQQTQLVINYTAQCFGLRLEARQFRAGAADAGNRFGNRDYRISINLKNIGTFLDLTSRSGTDQQY